MTFELGPLQRKWIEALESGLYMQCQGSLRHQNSIWIGYCCLGVANEVCGLGESHDLALIHTYKEIGLRKPNGDPEVWSESNRPLTLTGLNDLGKSFAEIAKILRDKPEVYFTESK